MLTIKDIARLAHVSKTTVSRTINNSGYVSKEAREKIEKIIRDNNYSPSATARSLSRRETSTVGVVIPTIGNEFFISVLKGISRVVDQSNLTLIYCNTEEDRRKEEKALLMLREQRVRGLIITPVLDDGRQGGGRPYEKLLDDRNIPTVLLDRHIDNLNCDGVYFDGYAGSYQAVEALIAQGHRKIATITNDLRISISRDRLNGYRQAMSDHGLAIEERYILKGDSTAETAYRLTMGCLSMADPPSAMHTNNNDSSRGFLKAVTERGLRIPEDIAFVGFDRLKALEDIGLRYSFVDREDEGMGKAAMKLLLSRMENPNRQKKEIIFPPILRMAGSEK